MSKKNVINSILIFSISNLLLFCCGVSSINYQNIGDCNYYDAEYTGACNLTLICIENAENNNFFEPNIASVCPSSSHNFEKYWIGTIDFQNCELSKFPNHAIFEIYYNLHTLDVSYLGLTALHSENFINSKNLTKLIASHNNISEISSNLFWESVNLNDVDLSFNKITKIDSDAFPTHVQILNLNFNQIRELNVQIFQKLLELKHLFLTHNRIVDIPPFLFHSSQNLIELDISFNEIGKIEEFAFFGDVNLEKLNLSHNQITEFYKQIVENHSNLKDLDISWNNITEIKSDTLKSLQNLVALDLSGNLFKEFNNKTFLTLVKLQQLNLSRTALSRVQPGTFSHQINLQTLDLSNNQIRTLDSNILPSQLNQLKWLSVESNQLREVNGFTSSSFTKIEGVVGSKFECSFLDGRAEFITWHRLGNISRPIKCIFENESIDERKSKDRPNELEEESVEVESMDGTENQEIENNLNGKTIIHDYACKEPKIDSSNQLLLITWINTSGLIIIAIALIWLISRGRILKKENFSSISYRKNDIVLLESTECNA